MKLVTGSSGFIGSNIEADLKWDRSTCDLTDYNRVLELFDQHPIKTVVHCAARHGSALEMGKDHTGCLLYTSPSPRDYAASRMPSSA